MKQFILTLGLFTIGGLSFGQSVGIGTENPDPSASLEVSSVTQGMLVPRMTTSQRDMIASPAQGLLVFDVTTNSFWFRNSSSWVQLVDSVSTEVKRSGPDKIYMGMTDKVGVGTSDPLYKMHVRTSDNEYGISHTTDEVDIATYASTTIGGWMGTRSDHSFNLYAGDGFNQFTLLPNGNIGLGTTMPYYKMHLVGSSLFEGNVGIGTGPANKLDISHGLPRLDIHPNNRPLYVTGDLGSGSNGIEFRHGNGTQGIGFGFNTIYAAGSNVNQDLGLSSKGTGGNLILSTSATERMRITGNGRVGVGTGSPLHTLHVAGKTYISDSLGIGTSTIGFPLSFSNSTGNKISLWGQSGNHFGFGIGPALLQIHTDVAGSDIAFGHGSSTSLTELMRIKGSGNVGIGINPVNKLDINNGGVRTGTHQAGLALYVTGNFSGPGTGIEFRHDNGTQGIGFGLNTIYAAGSNGAQDLGLSAKGVSGNLLFTTNNIERIRITGTGNIGIGITSPNAPLQFGNTLQNRKMVLYELNNNNHQFSGLGIEEIGLRYQVKSTSDNHIFYAAASESSSNELMRIKGNGNVAIAGIIESEPWIQATLGSGWTHGVDNPVRYYKDKLGIVHFQGYAIAPATPNFVEFVTLPPGYRPEVQLLLLLQLYGNNHDADVILNEDGLAYIVNGLPGLTYSVCNISYRAN